MQQGVGSAMVCYGWESASCQILLCHDILLAMWWPQLIKAPRTSKRNLLGTCLNAEATADGVASSPQRVMSQASFNINWYKIHDIKLQIKL